MALPVVIEIAIGLVFIYLILSMLTCEIQELITILLQWRATHLKRSIENLIAGGENNNPHYLQFTDRFYENPLIEALNQEAKGFFATLFRQLTLSLVNLYCFLTRSRNVFGSHTSAPSYIPAEIFATALLQQINIQELSQKISELAAKEFRDVNLRRVRFILDELRKQTNATLALEESNGSIVESEFQNLQANVDAIVGNFISGRTSLSESLDQLTNQLITFIDGIEVLVDDQDINKEILRIRLATLKQTITCQKIEPNITEVLRLIFDVNDQTKKIQLSPWLDAVLTLLEKEHPQLLETISLLPDRLKDNLLCLAEEARLKAKSLEEEVTQLEQEVANWFDRSMERASGVYKRNAKGIAILLGFLLALIINADTFYMISRLSKDTTLRSTISETAEQIVIESSQSQADSRSNPAGDRSTDSSMNSEMNSDTEIAVENDLKEVKTAVSNVLDELPLPLGWHPNNVQEQIAESQGWLIPPLKRIIGWLITGIALSMGAGFWYDTLGKLIRVRGTGDKPNSQSK